MFLICFVLFTCLFMVKLITVSLFKLKVLIYGIPNNVYITYFYKCTTILTKLQIILNKHINTFWKLWSSFSYNIDLTKSIISLMSCFVYLCDYTVKSIWSLIRCRKKLFMLRLVYVGHFICINGNKIKDLSKLLLNHLFDVLEKCRMYNV